jgi:probable HAF family extracellular repeat protein
MSTKLWGGITAAWMLALVACATEEAPTEPELAAGATPGLHYTVRDLGTLGGSYSFAFGINRDGAVVGGSATGDGQEHAFLWRNGTMTDLGVLAGGTSSGARAINRSGDVVGGSSTGDGSARAVLWSQGVMTDLGTLDGFGQSAANSINDVGQVVGYSDDAETGNSHAALWQNGAVTDLGTLGGAFSQAYDINGSGQVVGDSRVASEDWHAFLWQNGVMTDLGTLGGSASHAQGINDDGDVVGWSENAKGITHAVQWTHGAIIDLGPFDGGQGFATAINIQDLKVGFLGGSRSVPSGPAIFERRRATLLPTLGGTGGSADDVNDAGQVAGSSTTSTNNPDPHAVLWLPK